MNPRYAAVVVLGLLLLGLWYFLPDSSPDLDSDLGERNATTTNAELDKGDAPSGTLDEDVTRRTVPATGETALTSPTHGALAVHVTWFDGKPAPDIAIALRYNQPGRPFFVVQEEITDTGGNARFEHLFAGKIAVFSDRRADWKSTKTTIVAGETTDVKITIAEGLDVRGRVVDPAGRGVADAGVWMTRGQRDWLGGRIVARTDAEGAFRVRSVPADRSFGAIATGYAPTALVDLDDVKTRPATIRLELTTVGGTIEGTITSPSGDPIAAAVVCVGAMPGRFMQRRVDTFRETWTPLTTRTDAKGHYRFPGVAAGSHPIAVRDPNLAVFKDTVEVIPRLTTKKDVQLGVGFTVTGVIKDEFGKPVPEGIVRAFEREFDEVFLQIGQYDYEDIFGYLLESADADGRYRISHLPAGKRLLYATVGGRTRMGKPKIRVKVELTGADGEELSWNPLLDPGHTIYGTVTYRDGEPVKMHFVTLTSNKTGKRQSNTTDQEGRFRFTNLKAAHYSIQVQSWDAPKGAAPLKAQDVWPDSGEVNFVASYNSPLKQEPAKVRGRIDDAAGRLTHAGALVVILQTDRSWRTKKDLVDGEFEFRGLKPGKRRVLALSGEDVIHVGPWFEVGPGENKDVGTLVTQPGGSISIIVTREPGTEAIDPRMYLRQGNAIKGTTIYPGRASQITVPNLCVGSHTFTAYDAGMVSIRSRQVDVVAGREATLHITLRAAVKVRFEVTPPTTRKIGKLQVTIKSAKGETMFDFSQKNAAALPNPYKRWVRLGLGRYTLTVDSAGGAKVRHSFEVNSLDGEPPPIKVVMK